MIAQATPIIFIHGLFAILARPQAPHTPSVSQFLSPNPVSIPDLPGYGTKRHDPPEALSIGAAADFISAHLHELGYVYWLLGTSVQEKTDLAGTITIIPGVLATCGIRPPAESFENTQSRLLLLAQFAEEEYNLKHAFVHLHKGVTYTGQRILTFIKRLTGPCLRSLHHRFVA